MTSPKPKRRSITFAHLDELVADAERLHTVGYECAGQWDLAQVCGHLSEWMRYAIDGYPPTPWPLRPIVWVLGKTIGRRSLRKTLATDTMPGGTPTLRQTIPTSGADEEAAVAELRATVARFQAHEGPYHASPLFGPIDRATMTRLQLIHGAHHLSHLIPKDESAPAATT